MIGWAQFFLYVHFLWVSLVIIPVPIIILGGLFRWAFVRNPWFRYIHASMMAVVLLLTLMRIECPLTTAENYFRRNIGEGGYKTTFMETWVLRLLYQDLSTTTFLLLYLGFFGLIVALLFVFPPRRKKS
jgi:hypothetical protein